MELNCTNCGEQSSCWYGQNKEPKKCDSYWNASSVRTDNGVVPVVRCKDCMHFVEGEPYDPCECMKWKTKYGVTYTTPDGYCHKAERRTKHA